MTEQIVVSPVKIILYIFLCAIFLTFGPQFCHRLRYPLLRSLFRSRSFEKERREPVRVVEVGFILECTLLVYPGKCRFLLAVFGRCQISASVICSNLPRLIDT